MCVYNRFDDKSKHLPSPILLENVRFMVVAFFASRFLNTTIYTVVLYLDYYLAVLGWHIALGPTKSLTNVAWAKIQPY